jgi:signal transduction histidine kinase
MSVFTRVPRAALSRLTVAGRLTLLLVAVALVAALVPPLLFWPDRGDVARRLLRGPTLDRMAAVQTLAERLPDAELDALLTAVSGPTLTVWRAAEPPRAAPEDEAEDEPRDRTDARPTRSGDIARRLRAHESGRFRDREIRVLLTDRPGIERADRAWRHGPPPELLPSRRKIEIAVAQPRGFWLVYSVPAELVSPRWLWRTGVTALVLLALFSLGAWWVSRWTTRPLAALASAADRLAREGKGEPVPETGAPEMRRAAAAFNRMQARLTGLLAERTRMLGAIAHDVRTALTRLRLRLELIEDETQRRKAEADLAAVDTMLAEALAYARDLAATEPLSEVDLASLVRSAVDDLADAGQNATLAAPQRLVQPGRPVALRRAIDNLLHNAIAYGGAAEVSLEANGEGAVLRIADRGPGIPDDQKEAVFEPFFRIERSRSRSTGGSGLGLAVARAIIRAHGGELRLEDRAGGGLVAVATLPKIA